MTANLSSEYTIERGTGQLGRRRRLTLLGGLLGLVAVRLALSLVARATGFVEYNADGFARTIHAYEWSLAPRFEVGVWLPLQFWVTGAALRVWPDLVVTPVVLAWLASMASCLLLGVIGWRLGGPLAGWVAGLLAAAFPWSVWFGLSGLAEAPFAACVSLAGAGLMLWWSTPGDGSPRRTWPLWLAGLALLASTAIRYEGWFFSVGFALVGFVRLPRAVRLNPRYLGALLVPFAFPLVWVVGSALSTGEPFGFARMTSEITAAEGTHSALTGWERLVFYPRFVVELAWPVVLPAAVAVVWRRRTAAVLGYALWIAIEFALLSLVTARYSGIGAGRDRYVLSAVVLALPLVGLLVADAARRGLVGRLAAALLAIGFVWFEVTTLLGRQHPYPAPETVALAERLRGAWAVPPTDGRLLVRTGVAGEGDAYNESYALRVLSNAPLAFTFLWDGQLYEQVVRDQAPTSWIVDSAVASDGSAGSTRVESLGRYRIYHRPPPPIVRLAGPARLGAALTIETSGLQPGERAGVWLTADDGQTVIDLGQVRAGSDGRLTQNLILPPRVTAGRYTLSLRGVTTGSTGTVALEVAGRAP